MDYLHSPNQKLSTVLIRWIPVIMIFFIVSLSCATPILNEETPFPTTTPTITAEPTPTLVTPPTISEVNPIPQSTIGPKKTIVFYFNQPMEKNSVQDAISFRPEIPGNFKWVDNSILEWSPSEGLPAGEKLQIEISENAVDTNGLSLNKAFHVSYTIAGYLEVAQGLPAPDQTEVKPNTEITAIFNQPVVPLGIEEDTLAGFSINPQPQGAGEWINTSTYVFRPDLPLKANTEYTITVNTDLEALNGTQLNSEDETYTSWSFRTASPEVLTIEPENRTALHPDASIQITFNQPMNVNIVEENIFLTDSEENPVESKFEWNGDHSQINIIPIQNLDRSAEYFLTLRDRAQTASGASFEEDQIFSFRTISLPNVIRTTPPDGQKLRTFEGHGSFQITFNAPLAKQDFSQLIQVSPEIYSPTIHHTQDQTSVTISGFFQPDTRYQVRISPELQDIWGETPTRTIRLFFSTESYRPSLNIPILQLGSSNIFFLPEERTLPARATNIQSLTVTRAGLTLPQFILMSDYQQDETGLLERLDRRTLRQDLQLPVNKNASIRINLTPAGTNLDTGLYHFEISSPQLNRSGSAYSQTFLGVVSQIQMVLKRSAEQAFIWAVDLKSGEPVRGESIQIFDISGFLVGTGITDDQGMVEIPLPDRLDRNFPIFAVMSEPGQSNFSLATSNWTAGVSGWSFGIPTIISNQQPKIYLYTDRPIYRPGQTMFFRSVIRDMNNTGYLLPEIDEVNLKIIGPYSSLAGESPILYEETLDISEYGTVEGSYTLAEDAVPGMYSIEVDENSNAWLDFQVAEYRKPDIELQTAFQKTDIKLGGEIRADIEANYYFGSPAQNLAVQWNLFLREDYLVLPSGFTAGKLDTSWQNPGRLVPDYGGLGTYLIGGEGALSEDGRLTVNIDETDLPPDLDVKGLSELVLEVTIEDETGFPVSTRATSRLHPSDYYIGIKSESWKGQAGDQSGFSIQTLNWNAEISPDHSLTARFMKVVWKPEQVPDEFNIRPRLVPDYTLISSTDFQSDARGRARIAFTPPDPGTYLLEVEGDGAVSQQMVWVSGEGTAPWPQLPDQRLTLTADESEYIPGDTASILIPNPFQHPVKALVTIERGLVMQSEMIEIEGVSHEYILPIEQEFAPNVYAAVTLLDLQDPSRPDFRQGYLKLAVTPKANLLNVELDFDPLQAKPGESLNLQIKVTDAAGKPMQGEFSLALIDKAVLALTEPNATSIEEFFFGQHSLGVINSMSLAVYKSRIMESPADGLGGGGGGLPVTALREEFEDTAFWQADIVTDDNGTAHVMVELPDNLTTWVAQLRGITKDTLVGETSEEYVVSKELLIRPVTPRFVVAGDHIEIAAVIHNNSDQVLVAEANLQGSGFSLDDKSDQTLLLELNPGDRQRVSWWGIVGPVKSLDLTFGVHSGSLQDVTKPELGPIPVFHYSMPMTIGTTGNLSQETNQIEVISLPKSFEPTGGSLQLQLTPSLAALVLSDLDVFETYEIDYPEYLASRMLANTNTYQVLQEFGLERPNLQNELEENIRKAARQLMLLQNEDGGWSWSNFSSSDHYLTAYCLFAFTQAYQSELINNDAVLRSASTYLAPNLAQPQDASEPWQLDRLAFIYFALNEAGYSVQDPAELVEYQEQLSPWGKGMLALSIYSLNTNDERIDNLIDILGVESKRTATSTYWDAAEISQLNLSTPVFNTAVVTYTFARNNPADPLLGQAVQYLVENRKPGGGWRSSYETTWSMLALLEYLRGTGNLYADYSYEVSLNETPILSGTASGVQSLTPVNHTTMLGELQDSNLLSIGRGPGSGSLNYRTYLRVNKPAHGAEPLAKGIFIERTYSLIDTRCSEMECEDIQQVVLNDGQNYINARLTLTVPEDMYYVVIRDFIPGGTEFLDPDLKTSQIGNIAQDSTTGSPNSNWGWWYFSSPQIHDESIQWITEFLPAGSYELNYILLPTHAGEFQVLPAHAYQNYFPEVEGSSHGMIFTINTSE